MNEPAQRLDPEAAALLSPLRDPGDGWLRLVQASERPTGDRVLGEYEVLDEIRHGGQALVFRARHVRTGREVALKRLAFGLFASAAERRRFEREVDALLSLQHPGIVTVYGLESVGGVDMLAMEWVDGQRLDAWAARQPSIQRRVHSLLETFLQVCDAVQHAHQRGVVHRDVKPSNVLVDRDGRCRVLDFGLARRTSGGSAGDSGRTFGFVGTPAYAPPEQFTAGEAPVDVRGDVYSLGVVLFELLTGRQPFVAATLGELVQRIEQQEPPRPSSIAAGVGKDLDAIVGCALQKLPAARYATAHAFADDVRRHLAGLPVAAVAPSAGYVVTKWVRRHRAVALLAALLVVVGAGALVLGVAQAERIRLERDDAREARDRADEAREAATVAKEAAENQADKARRVANFYLDMVRDAVAPAGDGKVDFHEVLFDAAARARDHFGVHQAWAVEVEANLALSVAFRGRYAEAIELAERALQLQATLADGIPTAKALALRALGEAHTGQRHTELAVSYFEQAIADFRACDQAPQSLAATHHSLAHAHAGVGRHEDATHHYREALAINEQIGKAEGALMCRVGLAEVLVAQHDFAAAEPLLREAEAATANAQTAPFLAWRLHQVRGNFWYDSGSKEPAVVAWRRALEIVLEHPIIGREHAAHTHFCLARVLHQTGHGDEALPLYQRALELGVEGVGAPISHEQIAVLLCDRKDLPAAVEHSERAFRGYVAVLPPEHGKRVVAHALWLRHLHLSGDKERLREQLPALFASVRDCVAAGGLPDPGYWPRVHELAALCGEGKAACAVLDAALAVLQQGPRAADPQVAAIARHVAALPR